MEHIKLNQDQQAMFDRVMAFNQRHKVQKEKEQANTHAELKNSLIKALLESQESLIQKVKSSVRSSYEDVIKGEAVTSLAHCKTLEEKFLQHESSQKKLEEQIFQLQAQVAASSKALEDKFLQRVDSLQKKLEKRDAQLQAQIEDFVQDTNTSTIMDIAKKVRSYMREISTQIGSLSDIHAEEKEYWASQFDQLKEFRTRDLEALVKLSVEHTMSRIPRNVPSENQSSLTTQGGPRPMPRLAPVGRSHPVAGNLPSRTPQAIPRAVPGQTNLTANRNHTVAGNQSLWDIQDEPRPVPRLAANRSLPVAGTLPARTPQVPRAVPSHTSLAANRNHPVADNTSSVTAQIGSRKRAFLILSASPEPQAESFSDSSDNEPSWYYRNGRSSNLSPPAKRPRTSGPPKVLLVEDDNSGFWVDIDIGYGKNAKSGKKVSQELLSSGLPHRIQNLIIDADEEYLHHRKDNISLNKQGPRECWMSVNARRMGGR